MFLIFHSQILEVYYNRFGVVLFVFLFAFVFPIDKNI